VLLLQLNKNAKKNITENEEKGKSEKAVALDEAFFYSKAKQQHH
jgi:hypothetical protein